MDFENNNIQPNNQETSKENIVSSENVILDNDTAAQPQGTPVNDTYVSVNELQQNEQVYTYTSNSQTDNVAAEHNKDGFGTTQTFDTVNKSVEQATNTGIKVFFTLLSVTVALIIAVSAGFVLGDRRSNEIISGFTVSTQQSSKDNTLYSTDKTAVFNNVNQSVVCITVYTSKGTQGYASGVIYTNDGYIVTNDHVYSDIASAQFLVTLYDGREFKAKFIAGDTRSDLAVLKIEAESLVKATFGISSQSTIGEEVIAIGYPSGATGKSILTSGTISSTNIRFTSTSSYSMKMIQTDTPINPGNSGGALVNMYSQVIGIPSVKMAGTAYDNVGYAIPADTVVKVADSLIKNGYVEGRGRLGITYTAVDTVTAELNNVPTGLQVADISDDSNLNGKGIKVGDVITHINDVKITESGVALDIIESTAPDTTMSFTVYHIADKKSETVYATLVPDKGNSSYTNKVADEENSNSDNPFGNGDFDDFFSDH